MRVINPALKKVKAANSHMTSTSFFLNTNSVPDVTQLAAYTEQNPEI